MNEEKIVNLLGLIHKENIAIISTVLLRTCYPQDYEEINKSTIDNWESVFNSIMGLDDEEKQSGENDNSGATDSSEE